MSIRRHLPNVALALGSVLLTLAAAEVVLRAVGYRYSPILFAEPQTSGDARPFHMGTIDSRVSERDPLTIFDLDLLWRLNPRIGVDVDSESYRGGPVPRPRRTDELLVMAFGDSNTMGPLHTFDHWPGYLQDLVRLNRSARPIRVINAGVTGYSSFQGLRRFRRALPDRPDLAYFSFGSNDAQSVYTPDSVYADRVALLRRWNWMRVAAPLGNAVWMARDRLVLERRHNRVPLPEYRRNLEAFIDLARRHDVIPVLLTRPFSAPAGASWAAWVQDYNGATCAVARERGAACVDLHAQFAIHPDEFSDPAHLNRRGYRRLAQILVGHLRAIGILSTAVVEAYGSALDLGAAEGRRLELDHGWWPPEQWRDGLAGRWSEGDAAVVLERRHDEATLIVDLSASHPRGVTSGRVAVNGRTLRPLPSGNGRHRLTLDLGGIADRRLEVRFLVDSTFVSRELIPASRDPRRLGVFVHAVSLAEDARPPTLEPARLADDAPELVSGWWAAEAWPDGRSGRWTSRAATFELAPCHDESTLLVDATWRGTSGTTSGRVEADGVPVAPFRQPDGRATLVVPLARSGGRRRRVGLVVDRPLVPGAVDPGNRDTRTLGVFVHAVHLVDRPPGKDGYPRALQPATARDDAPALQRGWREAAPGGRSTGGDAELALEAPETPGALVLELQPGPQHWAAGRIDVNGELVGEYVVDRARVTVRVPVAPRRGRLLRVRIVTDRAPPEPSGAPAGILVHAVRFEPTAPR